jgi:uncharacterized DUF497 family protein
MVFDFDARNSRSNKRRHGIDFAEAQRLWNSMKAEAKELDTKFDDGEDITRYLDLSKARRWGRA